MKRVLVVFRGCLRGDLNTLYDYMRRSYEAVRWSEPHEKRAYLYTWEGPEAKAITDIDKAHGTMFKAIMEVSEPRKEECLTALPVCCYQQRRTELDEASRTNAYKMFYGNRWGLRAWSCDWLVYIRTEALTGVKLDGLDPEVYNSPAEPRWHGGTCDMAAACSPEVMSKAWDYGMPERLAKMFENSHNPEQCLSRLLEANGVKDNPTTAWFKPELLGVRPH